MPELKPTRELLRIYGLQKEDGEVCGLLIANQMPGDMLLDVLKQAVAMLEGDGGQHIKVVQIRSPGDIKPHTGV